jgi:hypothetical protein
MCCSTRIFRRIAAKISRSVVRRGGPVHGGPSRLESRQYDGEQRGCPGERLGINNKASTVRSPSGVPTSDLLVRSIAYRQLHFTVKFSPDCSNEQTKTISGCFRVTTFAQHMSYRALFISTVSGSGLAGKRPDWPWRGWYGSRWAACGWTLASNHC